MIKLTEDELNRLREVSLHRVLTLKENGRKVFINCPFHGEKTPSFCIYPDNSYHCFGCGKNGQNSLDFMVELEGDFIRAITELIKHV